MNTEPTSTPRTRWSFQRVARLGFLVGQGLDARQVTGDPMIASTSTNVHRQVQRFGLAFREATPPRLPASIASRLDVAAAKRALSRDGLIRSLVIAAASDDGLIDNILDDEA